MDAVATSRIPNEGAQQVHCLNVVPQRVLLGEVLESRDAAHAYCDNVTAQHLGALLVALVQQALMSSFSLSPRNFKLALNVFGLVLSRSCLALSDSATPDREQNRNEAANH